MGWAESAGISYEDVMASSWVMLKRFARG
jgi:hypothetical protein